MSQLLTRLRDNEYESLISFCHRLAKAQPYETPRWLFSFPKGVNFYEKAFSSQKYLNEIILTIASLTGISETTLTQLTLDRFKQTVFGEDTISRKDSQRYIDKVAQKFCPHCMAEQFYHRLTWQLTPISICTKHRIYLINKCPKCNKNVSFSTILNGRCPCGLSVLEMKTKKVQDDFVLQSQILIESKVLGLQPPYPLNSENPSHRLPSSSCLHLLTAFSEVIRKYPTPTFHVPTKEALVIDNNLIKQISPENLARCYSVANDIFNNWPTNYHQFLEEFKQCHSYLRYSQGIHKEFGKLVRHIRRDLKAEEYDFIREELLQFFVKEPGRYPVNTINQLFRGFQLKQFYTREDVLTHLGITRDRFEKLLKVGNITTIVRRVGSKNQYSISSDDLERIRTLHNDSFNNLTKYKVAEKLGITVTVVDQLISNGLLKVVSGLNDAGYVDKIVTKQSFNELNDFFLGQLACSKESEQQGHWLSLRDASRKLGRHQIKYGDLLRKLKDGELMWVLGKEGNGLNKLLISSNGVQALINKIGQVVIEEIGYSLPEAQKFFGADVATIIKWIEGGLIQTVNVIHNGKPSYRITKTNVEKFIQTYTFVSDASKDFNVPVSTLSGWINRGILSPVSGPKIDKTARHVIRRDELVNKIT